MVERKYEDQQSQVNYLENMGLLIWQNHIIKVDKKMGRIIVGAEMEGVPYFREVEIKEFGNWINNGTLYEELDKIIKILAGEVIQWRKEKESANYKEWKEKNGKQD